MKTRKTANRSLLFFIGTLLFFTLYGKKLYLLTLPRVALERPKRMKYTEETMLTGGQTAEVEKVALAVDESIIRKGKVFVVLERDGRTTVEERQVVTGREQEGMIEIISGLSPKERLVTGSDREYFAGDEVVAGERTELIQFHEERMKNGGLAPSDYLKKLRNRNIILLLLLCLATVVPENFIWRKLGGKFYFVRGLCRFFWFFCVCFLIEKYLVIPPEWIPDRLIDLKMWRENIARWGR